MRPAPVALAAAALVLALAGCVPSGGTPTASPKPSATPVFASDAEALKAAEAAYAAYLKVSDQIANDGGKDPERIAQFVTKDRLTVEEEGSSAFVEHSIHTSGQTEFSNGTLQQVARAGDQTEVVFYACWDASKVHVLDASGQDVTPAGRANQRTLEIVTSTVDGDLPLVLKSDNEWSGSSSC